MRGGVHIYTITLWCFFLGVANILSFCIEKLAGVRVYFMGTVLVVFVFIIWFDYKMLCGKNNYEKYFAKFEKMPLYKKRFYGWMTFFLFIGAIFFGAYTMTIAKYDYTILKWLAKKPKHAPRKSGRRSHGSRS